jgi:hypothetical protein
MSRPLVLACVVIAAAGCASDDEPVEIDDPCVERPVIAGGSVELGLEDRFTPVVDGQEVELVLGAQGFWMFVINARVHDMGPGLDTKAVLVDAVDAAGEVATALAKACRQRPFEDAGDGSLELTTGFLVPLHPSRTPTLDGAAFTVRLEIRDAEGHRATDQRTLIARKPR